LAKPRLSFIGRKTVTQTFFYFDFSKPLIARHLLYFRTVAATLDA